MSKTKAKAKAREEANAITVSARQVAAAAKWTSRDPIRTHLHMVLFARGEYVATDGHRMVRVPCETHGIEIGVDARHLLAAATAQRDLGPAAYLRLEPYEGRIRIGLSGRSNVAAGCEDSADDVYLWVPSRDTSKYPPTDQVIPMGKHGAPPVTYSLNPAFFSDVAEVIAASPIEDDFGGTGGQCGVDITGWGSPIDPVMLTSSQGVRFILMPMRGPLAKSNK
jgi:hypothetical protein